MGRFLDPPLASSKGHFLDEPAPPTASSAPSVPINPFAEVGGIITDIGNSAAFGIPGVLAQTSPRSGFVGLGSRMAGAPEIGPPMQLPTAQTPFGKVAGFAGSLLVPGLLAKAAGTNIARAVQYAKPEEELKVADLVRRKFFQNRRVTGYLFDRGLRQLEAAHPEQTVNLMDAVENLNTAITQNPRLTQDIAAGVRRQGNPLLQTLLDTPERAQALTLREAQMLKATMRKIPTLAAKIKRGPFAQYLDTDLDLLDFQNAVREAELKGFPQIKPVFQQFSKQKQRLAVLQPKMKAGQLIPALERGFREPETREAARNIFSPPVFQQMRQFTAARKLAKTAPAFLRGVANVAGVGGAGAGVFYGLRRLFG